MSGIFHATGQRSAVAHARGRRLSLFMCFAGLLGCAPLLRAQGDAAQVGGCTLQKGIYTCNLRAFEHALAAAHTVTVETEALDRYTATQLRQLARTLGKSVLSTETENGPASAADLTFLLIPAGNRGSTFGPEDHELATLQVYAPGNGSPHGTLLWAETLRGQGDRPWPAQVHALIEQFQAELGRH